MLRGIIAVAIAVPCATSCAHAVKDVEPGAPPPPVSIGDYLRLDRAKSGYQRPRPADEGCLKDALRRQPRVSGVENEVKFAVMRDGSLRDFVYLNPVPAAVAEAIETAFRACRWEPGLDPAGRPIAVWVIQPIKVAGAPAR